MAGLQGDREEPGEFEAAEIRISGAGQPRDLSQTEIGQLLEAAADWIWETGSDLRISWLSDSYADITGMDPAAVVGRFRFDLMDGVPQGSLGASEHLADLEARRPFRDFVYELKRARPDCRWISISGFPRYSRSGAFLGYRGIGRNVTFEVRALREAGAEAADEPPRRESTEPNRELRGVLDALKLGVVLLDADLRTEAANQAFHDMWRLERDDGLIGKPFRATMEAIRRIGIYTVASADWEDYVQGRLKEIAEGR
ncbi:MAG: PAS domain-containing protein, partial [Rhizobiaceae bacterium]|nr:PAS domain-containing protein [Rhizobiaceae bacterium]